MTLLSNKKPVIILVLFVTLKLFIYCDKNPANNDDNTLKI